jgi:undecaprenyl diphosphate synthase
LIDLALEENIEFLTLYAWSTENWKRSRLEQKILFEIGARFLIKGKNYFAKNGVKVVHLGREDRLPAQFLREVKKTQEQTRGHSRLQLNLCLDYGGRDEIIRAIKKIPQNKLKGIDEGDFAKYLDTSKIPDPDLIIRTSGECRLSNFLLWQCAYTELFFTDTLFPDFTKKELKKILAEFRKRDRREGK